ncbi:oxidoreductase [Bombardia bombarda]|uniref:Oxidoreductase n=1 Tax=Bombardia bombarda TaxID=252184 RepID=A0AA39U2V2_9PEZI|nr:oxidoreductase [Bombardia bombarda]
MPINRSIWQDRAGIPGAIREAPLPSTVEPNKIVVKVHAWAMNPCDAMLQDKSLPFIKYPLILGQDVAGVITTVGTAAAAKFKIGDRVFGFSINNGFQDYITLDHTLAARIPASLSFADASVFPLCVTTSSLSLFGKDYLGLPFPSLDVAARGGDGRSILIWGGSSAVGSNAIQLARAAGLRVVTTCSAHSFDYVQSIGADRAFDYNSPSVVDDVVAELDRDDGVCAGIYLAAGQVAEACKVSYKSRQDLFLASSNPVLPDDAPEAWRVKTKFTFGTGAGIFSETLSVTFGGFLVEALAEGVYKVAPPPEVVNKKGLEGVQEALDLLKKGVSAKKLVVLAE